MYAPSKPSRFKRSSENTRASDRQALSEGRRLREGEAEEQRRLQDFESIGVSASAAAGMVERRSAVHDESRYDVEGLIFP